MTLEIVLSKTRDANGSLKRRKVECKYVYFSAHSVIVTRPSGTKFQFRTDHKNVLYYWIMQ